MAERQACWAAWLEYYGAYQSADRTAYARNRLGALARGEAVPVLPELWRGNESAEVAVSTESERVRSADLPRSLRAAEKRAGSEGGPAAPCVRVCEPRRAACVARCDGDRGECVTACATEYRVCSRGCF